MSQEYVLAGVAKKVYLSHGSGAIVVSRISVTHHAVSLFVDSKPVDYIRTYRKSVFLEQLSRYALALWARLMNSVILGLRGKIYNLNPEWRFDPAPSVIQARPIISDNPVEICRTETSYP